MATKRIKELDYLKGIMIILVVIFHLVYINEKYPYLKQLVYTFHIPVFLILSGYLANVCKNSKAFGKTLLGLAIPYFVMETLYASMTAFLPVREGIEVLTFAAVADKVFNSPIGPYWYLYTLIICLIVFYVVNRLPGLQPISRLILLGVILYGITFLIEGFVFPRIFYFISGVAIQQINRPFTEVIAPSGWCLIPLLILFSDPHNLHYNLLPGYFINWLVISFLLWFFHYTPDKIRNWINYFGKNTLSILVFSPIFTILTKSLVPFFQFDPSGILFALTATTFVLFGCLALAVLSDRLHFSRFFFQKDAIYCALKK